MVESKVTKDPIEDDIKEVGHTTKAVELESQNEVVKQDKMSEIVAVSLEDDRKESFKALERRSEKEIKI